MQLFQKARWIKKAGEVLPDEYSEFRVTVPAKAGESYLLAVAADSNYALYLRGELIAFGQYADYPHNKVADRIPIHLSDGDNTLFFLLWYYGKDSQTYQKGDCGLIFEITEERSGRVLAHSSENTLSRLSAGFLSHEMREISGQLGFTYHYSAERGGMLGDFQMGDPFLKSEEVFSLPYDFTLRPVEKLKLLPCREGTPLLFGEFRYTEGSGRPEKEMQQAELLPFHNETTDLPLRLKQRSEQSDGIFLLVDLGEETVGFLLLEIELPGPMRIDIGFGEHLIDGRCRTAVRNYSAVYDGTRGRNRFLAPFRRFGCRYLQCFLHGTEAEILHFGIRPTLYPVTPLPYRAETALRQRIYNVSVHTLLSCMHEHYEDCPMREQALYTMDSRNQMLSGYYAFREYKFPRANLVLMSKGLREDGLLPICFPSGSKLTIPSFSLIYFLQVAEYLAYSGDGSILSEIYPTLLDILAAFRKRKRGNGLLSRFPEPGMWNFYEWSEGLSGNLRAASRGGEGETGEDGDFDCPLSALYLLALSSMAKIASRHGDEQTAAGCEEEGEAVKAAVKAVFFDRELGFFLTHPGDKTRIHLLTNALCLLSGAADSLSFSLRSRIASLLLDNGANVTLPVPVIPNTLSMNSFRFDALLRLDREAYRGAILDELDRDYKTMLDQGATTFWETIKGAEDFSGAGSLCHGWSALPIYYYRTLSGGTVRENGELEIRIADDEDRKRVFALRNEVFVREQGVPPEIEIDREDGTAMHVLAIYFGEAVGCARLLRNRNEAHIGRLAVKKSARGHGIGAAICRFLIDSCRRSGITRITLHSQYHAVGFYEKLGFQKEGEIFLEAGIEHITMTIGLS